MQHEQRLMPSRRNYSLDLLRLVAMLLIVALHSFIYSGIYNAPNRLGVNYFAHVSLSHIASVGVDCFWLLTGYFMATSRAVKWGRLFEYWLMVVFYSVVAYAIDSRIHPDVFSVKGLLQACTPILSCRYWFMTVYFGLALLAPYLNQALSGVAPKDRKIGLGILLGLISVLPSFGTHVFAAPSFSLFWAMAMYALGAVLRMDELEGRHVPGTRLKWGLACGTWIVAVLGCQGVNMLAKKLTGARFFEMSDNTFFVNALGAFCLFNFFRLADFRSNIIQTVTSWCAPCVLGVYLIHEAPGVAHSIWDLFYGDRSCCASPFYLVYLLFAIVTIFVGSLLLDHIRKFFFDKIFRR